MTIGKNNHTNNRLKSHSITEWLFAFILKSKVYSFENGGNSKLNNSLSGTSKVRAILNIVPDRSDMLNDRAEILSVPAKKNW